MVDALKKKNYHFNCAIRLGTFRLVRADVFSGSFFHMVGMGSGMIDLWDLAT